MDRSRDKYVHDTEGTEMSNRPNNYTNIGTVMSNFDHIIDKDVEEKLKTGDYYADYAGYNFFGEVWWEQNKWNCDILVYGSLMKTVTASTLEDIMEIVSTEYGWE